MRNLEPIPFKPRRRPLTEAERRALRAKIRALAGTRKRASKASLLLTGGGVLLLWLWTLWASDAPWVVVTAFWLVVGAAIGFWVRRDMRRDAGRMGDMARRMESALRKNAADVYDVRARRFAEFEEIEDEGAGYAFELDGDRLVFVSGQEFYESARFPSLDFSLAYALDEHGQSVDLFIEKRGAKAAPAKKIPAVVKRTFDLPEHLEMRAGTIDDLKA